jgi:hypothetical protein
MRKLLIIVCITVLLCLTSGSLYAGTMTATGEITSASRVDHWIFNLSNTSNLIIDVQAWESSQSSGKTNIPNDFFGDGPNNNKLIANIFLFALDGTLIGSSTGDRPGDVSPGAHATRSGYNPYLDVNVGAGTYILALGSFRISQADAWAGANSDGSSWTDSKYDYNTATSVPLFNKYNIILTAASGTLSLQHMLTVNTFGSGSVSPPGGSFNAWTGVSLTAIPDPGWKFSHWSGDLSSTDNPATITMDANRNVTANFSPLDFGLFTTSQGSGTITLSPPEGNYQYNTLVTLTAVPGQYWEFSGWSGDLSGSANPESITMNDHKSVTAMFSLKDTDEDGISDQDEDSGPNGGDANNDGILDSQQGNVSTVKSYDGKSNVVLESSYGTTLKNCQFMGNPAPKTSPTWVTFPYGFLEFVIEGVGVGGGVSLRIHLPQGSVPDVYFKYGATPVDTNDHWYRFNYDTTTKTGAEFGNNVVTLHFIDGAVGDDDLNADGRIMDIGAPGLAESGDSNSGGGPTTGPAVTGGGSTGSIGGCFINSLFD